ncbi:hypothetical protein D3C80_1750600 [compost metagenome]
MTTSINLIYSRLLQTAAPPGKGRGRRFFAVSRQFPVFSAPMDEKAENGNALADLLCRQFAVSAIENVYSRETAKLLRTIPAVSMIAADQVHGSGEDQERRQRLRY